MKKLLLVLAIGAFVACNNSTESTEQKGDTVVPAAVDTTAPKPADTTATTADTTAKPADTSAVKK